MGKNTHVKYVKYSPKVNEDKWSHVITWSQVVWRQHHQLINLPLMGFRPRHSPHKSLMFVSFPPFEIIGFREEKKK